MLNLGDVYESASVYLNGEKLETLLGPGYKLIIDAGNLEETNELEVKVSNLMANRIINMDKNDMNYKIFYNINFPARIQENRGPDGLFTATNWEPVKSGLTGSVSLTPVNLKKE
jgi:hypothetical protein